MVALSRCLGAALVLVAGVDGARVSRERSERSSPKSKFLGGIPVLNYDKAVSASSLSETAELSSVADRWMVVAKRGATDAQLARMCSGFGMKCIMRGHPSSGGVAMIEVSGPEAALAAGLAANRGLVQFAEPVIMAHAIPEEAPSAQTLASWGLDKVGVSNSPNKGAGVNIYIMDTGIHTEHNDFGGRASSDMDYSQGVLELCDGRSECARDNGGHGTHCAGTAAGTTYGVAPAASLFAIKVLSDEGSGSFSWSVGALDELAKKASEAGASPIVASMSLGGAGVWASIETAINAAVEAGVTVVVAGGNSNSDACVFSPAYVASAITVGSTTSDDKRSSFSNYGSCTDIWAPGSDITSAEHGTTSGAATMSGTSMACPHVSGASALILAEDGSLNSGGVLQAMLQSSSVNHISGLYITDVNNLLYVGADGPLAQQGAKYQPCPYTNCDDYCSHPECVFCAVCQR